MALNWKNEYYRYHRYFYDIRGVIASPRFRSFTWLSVTVFVVSFFLVVAIRPTLITIAKLQREIQDKEAAAIKLQEKVVGLIKAQSVFVNYLDDIEKLDRSLPNRVDYAVVAGVFEDLAVENGTDIASLSFNNLGNDRQIKNQFGTISLASIPFNLNVTGNYVNLKNFLINLENSYRIPIIDRTNFSATIKESGGLLTLSMTGNFLYQKTDNDKN